MSERLLKSPIFATVVIVGLVGVTALVAGYVDRPGTGSQVASVEAKCADCPKAGTSECCKVTGTCSATAGCSDGGCSGGACATKAAPAGGCPVMAATAAEATGTCASMSGCPVQAARASTCSASGEQAAVGGCSGGTCPAGK